MLTRFDEANPMRFQRLRGKGILEADSGMKSVRPDDRLVMERFILQLTA